MYRRQPFRGTCAAEPGVRHALGGRRQLDAAAGCVFLNTVETTAIVFKVLAATLQAHSPALCWTVALTEKPTKADWIEAGILCLRQSMKSHYKTEKILNPLHKETTVWQKYDLQIDKGKL